MKSEDVFKSFIRANMGDHGKSTERADFCPKRHFSQLETNCMRKKSFTFQFLAGVEISAQSFILGQCDIAKLQIFGQSS